MISHLPTRALLAIAALVCLALAASCGDGQGGRSVDSPLQLLPRDADNFTFADLEGIRHERQDHLERVLANALADAAGGYALEDWEINFDDLHSLILSDPRSGDALAILSGLFFLEDIEDALEDEGFRDDLYRDIAVWSERRDGVALALVGDGVIVLGEEGRLEEALDAFLDDERSMQHDVEATDVLGALEDTLLYSLYGDCPYRGCHRMGSGLRVDERDFLSLHVHAFRDDDAADDAERDIENDLENLSDDLVLTLDGTLVIAEMEVDEDQLLFPSGTLMFSSPEFGTREGVESPTAAPTFPPATTAPAAAVPFLGDDHGNHFGDATRIEPRETLDGDLEETGDVDFFRFSAERDVEYYIEIRLGSNSDTVLTLYGPDGDRLVADDDSRGGGGEFLRWTTPSSDTYYIEVRGYSPQDTGTYELELGWTARSADATPAPTQAPAAGLPLFGDDHGNQFDSATRIGLGDSLEGDIEEPGDLDFFRFSARRGFEYEITLRPLSHDDTVLTLYGPGGERLAQEDDSLGGRGEIMFWSAPSSDTYYIGVNGGDSQDTGTYLVTLAEDERPTPTAPRPTSTAMPTTAPRPAPTAVPTAAPTGTLAPTVTPTPRPAPTATPSSDVLRGGELTLAVPRDPFPDGDYAPYANSFFARQVHSLIFSKLWRMGPDGLEPDLAEAWEISEDFREFAVYLRRDVRFHDGRRVTAHDVAASLEAMHEQGFVLPALLDFDPIDDYTLIMQFNNPGTEYGVIGEFINWMAEYGFVVPRGLLEFPARDFSGLVGTGPFVSVEHVRDHRLALERNPAYYAEGLPYLDAVELLIVPE